MTEFVQPEFVQPEFVRSEFAQPEFAGVRVLVTGGTRGIGRAVAQAFVQAGAFVAVSGRDAATAGAVAAELSAGGAGNGRAVGLAADVGAASGCVGVVEAVVAELGGLDVVCANAGIYPQTPLEQVSPAEVARVIDVNLTGTVLLVQAAAPHLRASGRGRVVVTSSITGPITGLAGFAHYAASKAGQVGFVRTAALELADGQITVNAVLPGNTETPGLAELGQDYLDRMRAAVPLGRLGTPEDVAAAVLFFASLRAGFITGQTLVVDGGQVLPE